MSEWIDKFKDKPLSLLGLGSLILALLFALYHWIQPAQPVPLAQELTLVAQASPEEEVAEQQEDIATSVLVVDVKGAVANQGVYELAAGSRVQDAVAAAGGFLDTADRNSVNLAQKLTDEAVVYVAQEGEEGVVNLAGQVAPAGHTTPGKVNINRADASQLQTISGIGAKRAQDIIAYRESKGGFTSIEELTEVSGIGAKTLERIREEISLD